MGRPLQSGDEIVAVIRSRVPSMDGPEGIMQQRVEDFLRDSQQAPDCPDVIKGIVVPASLRGG